jgi:hypothetical protein
MHIVWICSANCLHMLFTLFRWHVNYWDAVHLVWICRWILYASLSSKYIIWTWNLHDLEFTFIWIFSNIYCTSYVWHQILTMWRVVSLSYHICWHMISCVGDGCQAPWARAMCSHLHICSLKTLQLTLTLLPSEFLPPTTLLVYIVLHIWYHMSVNTTLYVRRTISCAI